VAIDHWGNYRFWVGEKSGGIWGSYDTENEFVKYALERGGKVYLRDLVVFLQPENLQSILHLIDRNLRQYGESSAMELKPEEKLSPEMIADSEKTETHNSQPDKGPNGEGRSRRAAAYGLVLDYASIGPAVPFLLGISLALVLPPLWRYISAMFTSTEISGE